MTYKRRTVYGASELRMGRR